MFSVLLVLLVIVAVFMTGIILLQKSEGSGMSGSAAAAMFGGALTGAAAGNFLTKLTAWLAVVFFILCGALAYISSRTARESAQSELRQELVEQEPAAAESLQNTPITEKAEPVTMEDIEKVATKKGKKK